MHGQITNELFRATCMYIMRACMAFRIQCQIMQGRPICTLWNYAGLWACNFNNIVNIKALSFAHMQSQNYWWIVQGLSYVLYFMKIWVINYVVSLINRSIIRSKHYSDKRLAYKLMQLFIYIYVPVYIFHYFLICCMFYRGAWSIISWRGFSVFLKSMQRKNSAPLPK